MKQQVKAMIQADPDVTNGAMAEAVTQEVGRPVTAKDISRLRNNMGMGIYHLAAGEATRAVEAQTLARLFSQQGIRNTLLEDFHSGRVPTSRTGDCSDVKVVTPAGDIPWNQVSRLSDPEMRVLMLQVEQNLIALFLRLRAAEQEGQLEELLDAARHELFGTHGVSWDRPEELGKQS